MCQCIKTSDRGNAFVSNHSFLCSWQHCGEGLFGTLLKGRLVCEWSRRLPVNSRVEQLRRAAVLKEGWGLGTGLGFGVKGFFQGGMSYSNLE